MNLAFVNPWPPVTMGPNVGMRQLAREAVRRGHQVLIIAEQADQALLDEFGDRLVYEITVNMEKTPRTRNPLALARHLWRARQAVRRAAKAIAGWKADALCVNSENMLLMPSGGPRCGCPCVCIVRGARFNTLGRVGRAFFAIQQRWVNTYIGVSDSVVRGLTAMRVPPDKCVRIYNGVDTSIYSPGPRPLAVLRELGIGPDDLVIGTVSHLVPRKGVHYLLEAMSLLTPKWSGLKCVIVGGLLDRSEAEKDYERHLRSMATRPELAGRVVFAGPRRDIPELMRCFDVLVHPSETESFGRTVAEAMACAKPVVGFDADAVGELIDDGKTGFVAPCFDVAVLAQGIEGLLRDRQLGSLMGAAGRAKAVREYDVQANVGKTIDLLEGLAAGGRAY